MTDPLVRLSIRDATNADHDAVIALWQSCGLTRPWNDPRRDLARAADEASTRILVGLLDEHIVASVMVGYDGHRGWVYYLAVDPDQRRHGIGERMLRRAEHVLTDLGCPKIQLMVRSGQPALESWYAGRGYQANPVVVFGKRLIADD